MNNTPNHHDEIARIEAVRAALSRVREPRADAAKAAKAPPAFFYPAPVGATAGAGEDTDSPHLLYDFWRLLAANKWTLAGFTLAALLGGFFLSRFQQREYRATASLEVLGYNENFLNTGSLDPNATGSRFYLDSYVETLVKVLHSDALVDRVARRLKLEQRGEFQAHPGRLDGLRDALGLGAGAMALKPQEVVRQQVRSNLRIKSSRTDRILEIQYASEDPALAAELANVLAAEFIKSESESRWSNSERTAEFLDKNLADLKRKVQESEHQMQAYARPRTSFSPATATRWPRPVCARRRMSFPAPKPTA